MPKNSEQQLDLQFHEPITRESVERLLSIIVLSGDDYDVLVRFLEPVLEHEYQIIREVLENRVI